MTLSEFLETHEWCQGASAVNHQGEAVSHHAHDAAAWCLDGACLRKHSAVNAGYDELVNRLNDAVRRRGFSSFVAWNDVPGRTKDEVIALCKSIGE